MHTGVDWGSSMGTPIFASGNGIIEKAGWEGGYGKYIRIRHANGYETAYGHMSAFARGMEPGKKVRQGQVIGYVGSTGLSTGAHLHYEILINGRFVDPMKIKLPRGRVLEGTLLAGFEQERLRLDAMLTRASPLATRKVVSACPGKVEPVSRQGHRATLKPVAARTEDGGPRTTAALPSSVLMPLRRRGELAVEGETLLAGRDHDLVAVLDAARRGSSRRADPAPTSGSRA